MARSSILNLACVENPIEMGELALFYDQQILRWKNQNGCFVSIT